MFVAEKIALAIKIMAKCEQSFTWITEKVKICEHQFKNSTMFAKYDLKIKFQAIVKISTS